MHKRVDTPGTAAYQGEHRRVASHDDFIRAVHALLRARGEGTDGSDGGGDAAHAPIFLATDDATAERAFRGAFGPRLVMRANVRRTDGGVSADATLNEVHIKSSTRPSATLQDAVDVLCDALLLARCATVLHMDSNVTSAVAFINPKCEMHHIDDLCAP